jgi:hypothetical protein
VLVPDHYVEPLCVVRHVAHRGRAPVEDRRSVSPLPSLNRRSFVYPDVISGHVVYRDVLLPGSIAVFRDHLLRANRKARSHGEKPQPPGPRSRRGAPEGPTNQYVGLLTVATSIPMVGAPISLGASLRAEANRYPYRRARLGLHPTCIGKSSNRHPNPLSATDPRPVDCPPDLRTPRFSSITTVDMSLFHFTIIASRARG